MNQKGYPDEQIAPPSSQAEGDTAVAESCRKLGADLPLEHFRLARTRGF